MLLPISVLKKHEDDVSGLSIDISTTEKGKGLSLDGETHFNRRKKMLAAVATENFTDAFERYNGENNLLPINYLQIGALKSKAVGRIQFFDLEIRKPAVATGFLISNHLVVTNHHVFSSKTKFRDALIEFDYEYDLQGREREKIIFDLDPEKFFHSDENLDLAVIGIASKDKSNGHPVTSRGFLVMNGNLGKAGLGDYASIIQHAEGHPMQVALRENKIIDISQPDALIYNSDTAHGSSGSPVFNDQWQVIALHSAGVAKKDQQGNYLDKDGNVIPEVEGRVDASKLVWLSNRGTRVSAIMKHLLSQPDLSLNRYILELTAASYTDDKQLISLSFPETTGESSESPSLLPPTKNQPSGFPNVYINVNIGERTYSINPGDAVERQAYPETSYEKKLEDTIDFSTCSGFDEFFLGKQTPMPLVTARLKKQLAFFTDNPELYVLKYHHFSTMHHAVRKMPVVSAINITSDKRFRIGRPEDKWFRDRRIDLDLQLTDEFYKKSGFDKGHMTRREDAEWGDSLSLAETAADMTCSYTNACPQVPDLNRAVFGYQGKWGGLEIALLEKAVFKEAGGAKICVYNGPVFSEDDPVFKGIQVPMQYFKIVVWKNVAKKMKTTCFLLSQEKLVSEIPFEELQVDLIFKRYQCSIKKLEKMTGLNFSKIRNWDTFIPQAEGVEMEAIDKISLERFIEVHVNDDTPGEWGQLTMDS